MKYPIDYMCKSQKSACMQNSYRFPSTFSTNHQSMSLPPDPLLPLNPTPNQDQCHFLDDVDDQCCLYKRWRYRWTGCCISSWSWSSAGPSAWSRWGTRVTPHSRRSRQLRELHSHATCRHHGALGWSGSRHVSDVWQCSERRLWYSEKRPTSAFS